MLSSFSESMQAKGLVGGAPASVKKPLSRKAGEGLGRGPVVYEP